MIKHVILWQLKDEFSAEEKEAIKEGINTSEFRKELENAIKSVGIIKNHKSDAIG